MTSETTPQASSGTAAPLPAAPAAKPANGSFEVEGIVLACDAEDGFAPKPGQMLSLTGVLGVLVKEGRVVNEPAGIMPVQVQEFRLGK